MRRGCRATRAALVAVLPANAISLLGNVQAAVAIPWVVFVETGFGLAHESEVRYRYVVLVYFRDMDAVAAYDADPTHHAYVNNEFAPILADELVLTYALTT